MYEEPTVDMDKWSPAAQWVFRLFSWAVGLLLGATLLIALAKLLIVVIRLPLEAA